MDVIYAVDVIPGPLAVHIASRPGDARHSLADVTAAQGSLGYRAEVDFREGLRRTVVWYREHTSSSEQVWLDVSVAEKHTL